VLLSDILCTVGESTAARVGASSGEDRLLELTSQHQRKLYAYTHARKKTAPLCFTTCNFRSIGEIGTKFGTEHLHI